MRSAQIKYMVNRFLAWRLPENFNPDGGISFKQMRNENTPYPAKNEPVGTNLLDMTQAEEMIRYLVDGMPALAAPQPDRTQAESLPVTNLDEESYSALVRDAIRWRKQHMDGPWPLMLGEDAWLDELDETFQYGRGKAWRRDKMRTILRAYRANLLSQPTAQPPPPTFEEPLRVILGQHYHFTWSDGSHRCRCGRWSFGAKSDELAAQKDWVEHVMEEIPRKGDKAFDALSRWNETAVGLLLYRCKTDKEIAEALNDNMDIQVAAALRTQAPLPTASFRTRVEDYAKNLRNRVFAPGINIVHQIAKELEEGILSEAEPQPRTATEVLMTERADDYRRCVLMALAKVPESVYKLYLLPAETQMIQELWAGAEKLAGEQKRIVNGHVLKECNCGNCPVCEWGAGICVNCNAAEIELEKPCEKMPR